jgi:hypothetical protein
MSLRTRREIPENRMHYERKISKISDFLQTQTTHNEIKRDTRKRESFHQILLWAKLRNEKQKRNSILTKRESRKLKLIERKNKVRKERAYGGCHGHTKAMKDAANSEMRRGAVSRR